jgi:hypothetical protein
MMEDHSLFAGTVCNLCGLDKRIGALEAELAKVKAERDDLNIAFQFTFDRCKAISDERDAAVADAERYRALKPLYDSADFDYGDPPRSVIVFTWDRPVCANLDAMLDAALAARKEGQ